MKSKLKVATLPSGNGKWMLVSSLLLVLLVAATQAADEVSAVKKGGDAMGNGNQRGKDQRRSKRNKEDNQVRMKQLRHFNGNALKMKHFRVLFVLNS